MTASRSKPVIPIVAAPASEQTISLYQKTSKVYPRSVSGYFKNWRWFMIWATQLVFYGLPWLQYGGRQAFLLDIDTHRFYLFGLVIFPQDLFYLAMLLIICAVGLFLFTAVAGRLWCGFSCPQSVYTEIFLWMERRIEGDRLARQKLDAQPWGLRKTGLKLSKHSVWLGFSLITGLSFVGYFTPIRELVTDLTQWQLGGWSCFWLGFYSLATYGNAGFLREQVCKHMCPYARFQSAMFDNHTLIVAYDSARGEPRGHRAKSQDYQSQGLGACIDCSICVQVCPVGIDIRNGLQYECISCGLCIDACNDVMDKMHYPRDLIRFSAAGATDQHALSSHLLRPRVLIYSSLFVLMIAWLGYGLLHKPDFKVDIMRDRNILYRETNQGIENAYQLHLTNATEHRESYQLRAIGLDGLQIESEQTLTAQPTEEVLVPMSLLAPAGNQRGSQRIQIEVTALSSGEKVSTESTFYQP
ncbi:cytochrome c oxidase accessory protein CcoG [Methylophilus sp. YYY-1]|uniref:cytochrome c oxidase accessory protein CcoG n=1 Tax=Methylophilus sp. YYY-1 TaxID=2682087 RepID=UPI0023B33321|nr:cytochrome c oxidase accessory protein CcoG [Methylophilus sp. YYY-1]MDF0377642.1 cytochrome c oxidase accessory protein CcoG [Methylophilus sp. YYY-1]